MPAANFPAAPAGPLLAQRNFSALLWGQLISIVGERLTYLALVGMLAEHTAHFRDARSSLLLSLLANVMLAPVLILAPFTGAWIDRWNLKRVLWSSDLARAALVALIPLFYRLTHHTGPMFALVFGLFAANVLFLPAKSAMTPAIVRPEQLLAANALLSGAGIIATVAGALGGGWFIDHLGWSAALYVNAATYLVSVIALLLISYRSEPHAASGPAITAKSYLAEVSEGWAVVRANRTVVLALVALGAVWVGGGFLHVAGNLHIQRAASAPGMERLGLLMAALGLGGLLSTLWVNTHGRAMSRPVVLGGGLLIASVGVVAFAVSTRFAVFAIAAFMIGLAIAPAFMLSETLLQEATEPRQRGRVFSARDFLMRLVFLFAVTGAGAATRWLGVQATLLVCAGLIAAAGVVALGFRGMRGTPAQS